MPTSKNDETDLEAVIARARRGLRTHQFDQELLFALLTQFENAKPQALPEDYRGLLERLLRGVPRERRMGTLARFRRLKHRVEPVLRPIPAAQQSARIIARFSPQECPPYGGIVLWNGAGRGALKWAREVEQTPLPAFRSGGLETYRGGLVLGDAPLIQYDRSVCSSCEVLLQAGERSPEVARQLADVVGELTLEAVRKDPEAAVEAMLPLVEELMAPGPVLLALNEPWPSDGHGAFFWTAFDDLAFCDAWRARFARRLQAPSFLVPTQPLSSFREEAWARSAKALAEHPGIAFHLGDQACALLDGHHRALRAAHLGQPMPCVTLAAGSVLGERFGSGVRFAYNGLTLPKEAIPPEAWDAAPHGNTLWLQSPGVLLERPSITELPPAISSLEASQTGGPLLSDLRPWVPPPA